MTIPNPFTFDIFGEPVWRVFIGLVIISLMFTAWTGVISDLRE